MKQLAKFFFIQDMSLAILSSLVLINWKFMPNGEMVSSEQKIEQVRGQSWIFCRCAGWSSLGQMRCQ
jgi:hypothetical protein